MCWRIPFIRSVLADVAGRSLKRNYPPLLFPVIYMSVEGHVGFRKEEGCVTVTKSSLILRMHAYIVVMAMVLRNLCSSVRTRKREKTDTK